jgi:hypothetical protein
MAAFSMARICAAVSSSVICPASRPQTAHPMGALHKF